MYCIYTEGSRPGTGRIASAYPLTKRSAIDLATYEARFGRLRGCDFVAVMPITRARHLIRTGRRA